MQLPAALETRLRIRRARQHPAQREAVGRGLGADPAAAERWAAFTEKEQWALVAWIAEARPDEQPARVADVLGRLRAPGSPFDRPTGGGWAPTTGPIT